jgi:hypothetical protein
MAKKQTRRTISISRPLYEQLKSYCEMHHIGMSTLVEQTMRDAVGMDRLPTVEVYSLKETKTIGRAKQVIKNGAPAAAPKALVRPPKFRPIAIGTAKAFLLPSGGPLPYGVRIILGTDDRVTASEDIWGRNEEETMKLVGNWLVAKGWKGKMPEVKDE